MANQLFRFLSRELNSKTITIKVLSLLTIVSAVSGFSVSCGVDPVTSGADEQKFQTRNLRKNDFGLKQGEVVLTLDDGVGKRSKALAQFLRAQDVPTVFFVHAQNNKNDPSSPGIKNARFGRDTAAEICRNNFHSLSSHRDDHNTFGNNAPSDLDETDKLITEICPAQDYLFYRAPGGNFPFAQAEPLNRSNVKDIHGVPFRDKYIGPVHWDFACDTEPNCKTQDPELLARRYRDQIVKDGVCKGGIILAHDIHDSTIQAITGLRDLSSLGPNSVPGPGSLITLLRQAGCEFVALDKDSSKIAELLGREPQAGGRDNVDLVPPVLAPQRFPDFCKVKVSGASGIANVRSEPNTSSSIVAVLGNSNTVKVTQKASSSSDWYAVEFTQRTFTKGFMHVSLLNCAF